MSKLLAKLAARLFDVEGERDAFVRALSEKRTCAPCLAWVEEAPPRWEDAGMEACRDGLTPAWTPEFIHRMAPGCQPGRHPWHEQGRYYCLDFSSVFAASAMLAAPSPRRVLDLCAAPGGKTIFAWLALRPEFLLANEIIGKRLAILRHNLARCRAPAHTQRLDPQELAELAPAGFNLVLVDAPCSGQSLLARGVENPGCFHPATVQHNARRQRRVLAAAARTVAPGGWLVYSTCTFSWEENERVIDAFLRQHSDFHAEPIPWLEPWRSRLSEAPAYRLYPHQGLGAGAFVALLGKKGALSALPDLPPRLAEFPCPTAQSETGLGEPP